MGFGRIGQALTKRCLGFEANIYVYDPFVNKQIIETNKCNKIDFADGLGLAEFISVHVPLNKETKNLIAKEELKQMKENCILVNTARGGIINEKDLISHLKINKQFGVSLDVFNKEPLVKSHIFWTHPNVTVTPHIASITVIDSAIEQMHKRFLEYKKTGKINFNTRILVPKINKRFLGARVARGPRVSPKRGAA